MSNKKNWIKNKATSRTQKKALERIKAYCKIIFEAKSRAHKQNIQ